MLLLTWIACTSAESDSAAKPEVAYETAQVSGVSATLDDDFGALVWVEWEQTADAEVWVEYRFEGDSWSATPVKTAAVGAVRQLVAGVPYGESAELRVVNDFGDGPLATEPIAIETDPLPEFTPVPGTVDGDAAAWDPGTNFVLLSLADGEFGSWILIVDRQGRPVWALPSPNGWVSLHPRISLDGTDLLVDENSYWAAFDDGAASRVLRMKLDGTVVETMDTPGLHHPFTDLPDGSILFTAYKPRNDRSETLDRRWPDGSVTTVWDCRELLDAVGDSGYCGSNTLWYNPADGHVLNSLYSLETIVDVEHRRRRGGALVRPHHGFVGLRPA